MVDATRIRDGRVLMGVTQADLAAATNLQQPLISMFERGERPASHDHVRTIAGALGLPISFFEFRPLAGPGASPDFRRMKSAKSRDTEQARQLFREAFRVAEDLLDGSRYPRPTLPVIEDEGELSVDRIEEIAQETRAMWGLDPDSPIPHLVRTMERRGIVICPLVLPDDGDEPIYGEGKSQHFGASYWLGVAEPALVGLFVGSSGDRDRFTAAHEAGHIVLHTFRAGIEADAKEREANLFAGALLAPARSIAASFDERMMLKSLAQLKATWGLSMQALVMRGQHLGLLSAERSQALFRQISARGWRKNEPVHVPHEAPKLMRKLIEARYGSNPFLDEQIVVDLGLPRGILRSLAPDPVSGPEVARDNVTHIDFQSRARHTRDTRLRL